jgi:hypothetical protein
MPRIKHYVTLKIDIGVFMKRILGFFSFLTLLCALSSSEALATTRRVPADFPTIQQAIDAAVNGDTVLVAAGTYVENINFIGKAITVTSESGPQVTIIDGGGTKVVVQFNTIEGPESILSGFTIRNGGRNILNSIFSGGIVIVGASPTIVANIISENLGERGGGIFILTFTHINPASPTIKNNTISKNKAFQGAGIAISAASPIIQGNIIIDNGQDVRERSVDGGGLFVNAESAQILDNLIANNKGRFGGGLYLNGAGNSVIRGNIIRDNSASTGGGMDIVNFSPVQIIQNLIINNKSGLRAGGISWSNSPAAIINNTIANNDCPESSGVFAVFSHETEFINNIVVAKAGQPAYTCSEFSSPPLVFRSNNIYSPQGLAFAGTCFDQTGMNGNISADPLFVNPSAGDYHLRPGSPSIDKGDNSAPNLPSTDLDGKLRIQDGNKDGVAIVDMGAYEFTNFDFCIQDDSSGSILQINTNTGEYQFTNCSGFTISGTGSLTKRGSTITLQHTASDRRVMVKVDGNKATASIQMLSQGLSFTLTDRNTANNTCACR